MNDPNECHKDYWGRYIPKACPRKQDDHCLYHCPEDPFWAEEEYSYFDSDTEEAYYDLVCYYCSKNWGEKIKQYEKVEKMNECDHTVKLSIYAPYNEKKDDWWRNVTYRTVKLYFDPNTSLTSYVDNPPMHYKGLFKLDFHGSDILNRSDFVYCPKCGKKLVIGKEIKK